MVTPWLANLHLQLLLGRVCTRHATLGLQGRLHACMLLQHPGALVTMNKGPRLL